jgi:hypothetical protein
MGHIKNFKHLINFINNTIDMLSDEEINTINNNGGIGDAEFYYEHVYNKPYTDDFTWQIKTNPVHLAIDLVAYEYYLYNNMGVAYGKDHNKKARLNQIPLPKNLENE